ncbi:MAG: hypothetical protein ACQERC_04745 [Bacteroidota bacterium]
MNTHHVIILATTFLWLGFVGAISFMEAWLKFRAPGITLPLGLGIGRLVFHALNIVEWVLLIGMIINLYLRHGFTWQPYYLWMLIPFVILVLQTVWVLPVLDARAEMHIQGVSVPPSKIHLIYVLFEIVKVSCLLTFGIKLFKKFTL